MNFLDRFKTDWAAEVESIQKDGMALLQSINLDEEEDSIDEDDPARYEGELQDGKKHGIGTFFFKGGNSYEGQWEDDKRSGYGTYTCYTGEKYQGQWIEDLQEGLGAHSWKNGEFFQGTYLKGSRIEGQYSHGDPIRRTFVGKWDNDTPAETGTLELEDGQYKGMVYIQKLVFPQSVAGRFMLTRHIKGEMVYKNGDKYKGTWNHDVREGFGVLKMTDGTVYHGSWRSDKMGGHGILQYPDGTYYEGNFYGGHKHGEGKICFPNGSKIVGEFNHGNVGKSSFVKGDLKDVARPIKTIFLTKIKVPMKVAERHSYASLNKWRIFISREVEPKFQEPTADDIMEAVRTPDSIVELMVNHFSQLFQWFYKEKSQKNDIVVVLSLAIDDISSFVDAFIDVLNSCCDFQLKLQQRSKIYRVLTSQIFEKIHDIIFPLYQQRYQKKDAKLKAKYRQLSGIQPNDIGIHPKYQLTRAVPMSPSKQPKLAPTPPVSATPPYPGRRERRSSAVKIMENYSLEEHQNAAIKAVSNQGQETNDSDSEETEPETVVTSIEGLYSPKNEPYYPLINLIQEFVSAKTPRAKMKSLLHISNGIVACVNQYCKALSISPHAMGAEDKFPVLIYTVLKAKTPLYAHCQFLSDFEHPSLTDPESIYRIEELTSVLKFICSLDFKVRDEAGVLVPLHLVERSTKWELKKAIELLPAESRASSLQLFLKVLLAIGERPDLDHLYDPFILSEKFDEKTYSLVSSNLPFFEAMFQSIGLKVETSSGPVVSFIIRYPLYVYNRMCASLMEFYTDEKFVTTGKLDGIDPDDAFSAVPYKKGSNFLVYLESLVGGPSIFEPFIRSYIQKYRFSTVTSDEFKEFFLTAFKDVKPEVLNSIEWDRWFFEPGMPIIQNKFDRSLTEEYEALAAKWRTDGGETATADQRLGPQILGFLDLDSLVSDLGLE